MKRVSLITPSFQVKGTRDLIAEQLEKHGWTQQTLADTWRISRQNLVNRIRRPTRNLAYDIAMEFNLPLRYVVERMSSK